MVIFQFVFFIFLLTGFRSPFFLAQIQLAVTHQQDKCSFPALPPGCCTASMTRTQHVDMLMSAGDESKQPKFSSPRWCRAKKVIIYVRPLPPTPPPVIWHLSGAICLLGWRTGRPLRHLESRSLMSKYVISGLSADFKCSLFMRACHLQIPKPRWLSEREILSPTCVLTPTLIFLPLLHCVQADTHLLCIHIQKVHIGRHRYAAAWNSYTPTRRKDDFFFMKFYIATLFESQWAET